MSFVRHLLRTTDLDGARAFYLAVLGFTPEVVPLPAQALARGARPHWLGHLGVEDVEDATRRFVELGATKLGSPPGTCILRDPGGAIVAFEPRRAPETRVLANVNNSGALLESMEAYRSLFGWTFGEPVELGAHLVIHPFAHGAFVDVKGRPGVHTHWLFQFPVSDLDRAMDEVRARGGLLTPVLTLPSGERVVACDDPQGAAFAMRSAR